MLYARRPFLAVALVLSSLFLTLQAAAPVVAHGSDVRVLNVGALLPLSTESSASGTRREALQIAAEEINAELADAGADLRVRLTFEDTRLKPRVALEKLKALYRRGIRTIVGPFSSAELVPMKRFADAHGILILSPDSTASSLSIPGDNVLRFVPSDISMGHAIAALMVADGVAGVVPMWRGDTGNDGIARSLRTAFTDLGGYVDEGVRYAPDTTDFSGPVADLAARVLEVKTQHVAGKVAVFLSAFDEAVDIMHLARQNDLLSASPWYGSDGTAQSPVLAADHDAAAFAASVGYPNSLIGLDESARSVWEPLSARIQERTGVAPDTGALAYYDALRVAALAHLETGPRAPVGRRRRAVVRTADRYFGATGWTKLNSAGDRRAGSYDFWALREEEDGSFAWHVVARYTGGQIVR